MKIIYQKSLLSHSDIASMKRLAYLPLYIFLLLISAKISGQESTAKPPKGKFYLAWGYNKDWFSRSDLHFTSKGNNDYDFTVYDVTAHDRPNFGQIFNKAISIPQFIYRVGYTFAKHSDMGIEIGFDHAKYIMDRNDVRHVKGKIYENYIDKDTLISENFLRFEHTNGANFLMVSFVKKHNIVTGKSGNHKLFTVIKPGAGIVIPQSEVYLFGTDQNNVYHIAGYVIGLDLGIHYEYKKHLFFETGFKGVYANYIDVLSVGDARANHHFFCLEWLLCVGYQFSI